jgi:hypothetical protein
LNNVSGSSNTASGAIALQANNAVDNTAIGSGALDGNINGINNTAVGLDALDFNTSGIDNTAVGFRALLNNLVGSYNTAVGVDALLNTIGRGNVGLGAGAGNALTTGSGDVCIGPGMVGVAGESNTTRIRNVYSSVASGRAVFVNSDNEIGTLSSSRRYKEEIKPMDKASEALFALKPVTFRYKREVDPAHALSFGLIAEEVAEISPELITRDEQGKPETVRYEAVNAMLLKEFLKEHKTVQEQGATMTQQRNDFEAAIARQQKQIEALTATVKEQAAQIQKVSAQLEVSKAAPQTVVNNQ